DTRERAGESHRRSSQLHRRGLQHTQTTLSARLLEPRAIRGPPGPAEGQNRRVILSSSRGALQIGVQYATPVERKTASILWQPCDAQSVNANLAGPGSPEADLARARQRRRRDGRANVALAAQWALAQRRTCGYPSRPKGPSFAACRGEARRCHLGGHGIMITRRRFLTNSSALAVTTLSAAEGLAQGTLTNSGWVGTLEGRKAARDRAATRRSLREAQELADLVKQGKLPPVEKRLPSEPLVLKPLKQTGRYGGTWRRGFVGPGD